MDKASAICSTSCQMLLGASEISIIRVHTASYAITFLSGGSFFVAFDLQLYSVFDDDLQGICLYSMVALHITFARINYSPREGKVFSSRE